MDALIYKFLGLLDNLIQKIDNLFKTKKRKKEKNEFSRLIKKKYSDGSCSSFSISWYIYRC